MTMAVSKAVEEGATAVICASTGNTSASAAAYAARAGLTAAVVIPEGKIAAGKLAQALAHGARVLALDGGFDDALMVVRELVRRHPIALVNASTSTASTASAPAAFEVCDDLGDAPDVLASRSATPATSRRTGWGSRRYREAERSRRLPRLYGFQAAGAAPLVDGARRRPARDGRHRDPHRQPRPRAARRSTRCASRAAASPP